MKKILISILIATTPLSSCAMEFFQNKLQKEGSGDRKYLCYCSDLNKDPKDWGLSEYNISRYTDVMEKHLLYVTTKKENISTHKKNLVKKALTYSIPGMLLMVAGTCSNIFSLGYINNLENPKVLPLIVLGSCASIAGFVLSLSGIQALSKYFLLNRHVNKRISDDETILKALKHHKHKTNAVTVNNH